MRKASADNLSVTHIYCSNSKYTLDLPKQIYYFSITILFFFFGERVIDWCSGKISPRCRFNVFLPNEYFKPRKIIWRLFSEWIYLMEDISMMTSEICYHYIIVEQLKTLLFFFIISCLCKCVDTFTPYGYVIAFYLKCNVRRRIR